MPPRKAEEQQTKRDSDNTNGAKTPEKVEYTPSPLADLGRVKATVRTYVGVGTYGFGALAAGLHFHMRVFGSA